VPGVPSSLLREAVGHVRPFSIVSLSTTSLHGLMLVRDSKSRCTSDSTLTVTCYKGHPELKATCRVDCQRLDRRLLC